jgi:hypothetical protein
MTHSDVESLEPTEPPDPEEFAEAAGIDPTPQEVDEYQKLARETPPWSGPE